MTKSRASWPSQFFVPVSQPFLIRKRANSTRLFKTAQWRGVLRCSFIPSISRLKAASSLSRSLIASATFTWPFPAAMSGNGTQSVVQPLVATVDFNVVLEALLEAVGVADELTCNGSSPGRTLRNSRKTRPLLSGNTGRQLESLHFRSLFIGRLTVGK